MTRIGAVSPGFDPRLRAGGDSASCARNSPSTSFDPRLRAGGDSSSLGATSSARPFRSTPPRGRRLARVSSTITFGVFRSTPPRGRRQPVGRRHHAHGHVSIHASAREATVSVQHIEKEGAISRFARTALQPENSATRPAHSGRYRDGSQRRSARANLRVADMPFLVHARIQNRMGPARSRTGLAPTCSMRARPFAPSA